MFKKNEITAVVRNVLTYKEIMLVDIVSDSVLYTRRFYNGTDTVQAVICTLNGSGLFGDKVFDRTDIKDVVMKGV